MTTTTWIGIMRFAKALDEGRRAGQPIEASDAERLVSMLLDFQRRALHDRPTPAQGIVPGALARGVTRTVPAPDEPRTEVARRTG